MSYTIDFTTFDIPSYEDITITCNRGGSIIGKKITFTNGLTMVVGRGQVSSTSTSGIVAHNISWGDDAFTNMWGANLNIGVFGDTNSYLTYCSFTNDGAEFYINKITTNNKVTIGVIAVGT